MSSNQKPQQNGTSTGERIKPSSTGGGNARLPSSTGGGANPSSTGDEKKKRVCIGSAKCNDFHCPRLTNGNGHNAGHSPPTVCFWAGQQNGCRICNKQKKAPSDNCVMYQCCKDRECNKKHDPKRDEFLKTGQDATEAAHAVKAEPLDLTNQHFPSLGGEKSHIVQEPTGNAWAKAVGGLSSVSDFSKEIGLLLDVFPPLQFEKMIPTLKKRLECCKTDKDFMSLLNQIKDAFEGFLSEASSSLDSEEKIDMMCFNFIKAVFGKTEEKTEEFPDLPQDSTECMMLLSNMCTMFVPIYEEISSSLCVVEETSATCSEFSLITDVTKITYAIRQLEDLSNKIAATDILSASQVTTMITMLKSVSASNLSATTWCSSYLIDGALISAKKLLEQVNLQQKRREEEARLKLRELLLNPIYEKRNEYMHYIAYLYAISFNFGNQSVYASFSSSLQTAGELNVLTINIGKFFKFLVGQIYKHLISKPEQMKAAFDEKNESFLLDLLTSAFDSMKLALSQDPNEILKFLQIFNLNKSLILSSKFVDFLYTSHTFKGNEGTHMMAKIFGWYMTVIKDYFNLEIKHGPNFQIGIYVLEDMLDDKGDKSRVKVDITNTVMHHIFELVCYAEVCRLNKKPFPFGNISNTSSLALELNKVGNGVTDSFQSYCKGSKDKDERSPTPYNDKLKTDMGLKLNSEVVKFFLSTLIKNLIDQLDKEYHLELENVRKSFFPPNDDFKTFFGILSLFGTKEMLQVQSF